jgi:hypothetical protein
MVMFFRLCNSPSTFQAMMNTLFVDIIMEGWAIIYMDDILIFAEDSEKLGEHTERVLQQLKENNLYLKPKCIFDKEEVEYLRLLILHNQIKMDPIKLIGIKEWPTLTRVKKVRSFPGFANFYR